MEPSAAEATSAEPFAFASAATSALPRRARFVLGGRSIAHILAEEQQQEVALSSLDESAQDDLMASDDVDADEQKRDAAAVAMSDADGAASGDAASSDGTFDDHLESCIVCGRIGELLECDSCPLVYHLRCAGLRKIPEGFFRCAVCSGDDTLQGFRERRQEARARARERRPQQRTRAQGFAEPSDDDESSIATPVPPPMDSFERECAFCRVRELPFSCGVEPLPKHDPASAEERLLGPWREEGRQEDIWVHRACAVWSPQVFMRDGRMLNVVSEVQRARWLHCSECGKRGASIGCFEPSCPRTYHLPCAKNVAQACMLLPSYKLFCPDHAVEQNLHALKLPEPLLGMRLENARLQAILRDDGPNAAAHAGLGTVWGLGNQRREEQGFYSASDAYSSFLAKATAARVRKHAPFAHLDHLPLEERKRRRKVESRVLSLDEEEAIRNKEASRQAKKRRRHLTEAEREQEDAERARARQKQEEDAAALVEMNTSGSAAAPSGAALSVPAAAAASSSWGQVGGLDAQIHSLKECVLLPLLYPELFAEKKITPPKGAILVGPPGTGKTLLARSLAAACSSMGGRKVTFFARKGADVLSRFHGDAEQTLRALFDKAARMAPSIIFFDELDGLASVRSAKQNQVHSSVVATLLALMDGLAPSTAVFVLATTNRIDSIDPALRRPGRFDREVRVGLPNAEQRRHILAIHTAAWPKGATVDAESLRQLATKTSGFSGADLCALCSEAVLLAAHRTFGSSLLPSESALGSLAPRRDAAVVAGLEQLTVNSDDFRAALARVSSSVRRHDAESLERYGDDFSTSSNPLRALLQPKIDEAISVLDLPSLRQESADTPVLEAPCNDEADLASAVQTATPFPLVVPSTVHRVLLCDSLPPPPSRVAVDHDGVATSVPLNVVPRSSNAALLASALLAGLDVEGCIVRRLDIPSLLLDKDALTLEEACVRVFQQAQAHTTKSDRH